MAIEKDGVRSANSLQLPVHAPFTDLRRSSRRCLLMAKLYIEAGVISRKYDGKASNYAVAQIGIKEERRGDVS